MCGQLSDQRISPQSFWMAILLVCNLLFMENCLWLWILTCQSVQLCLWSLVNCIIQLYNCILPAAHIQTKPNDSNIPWEHASVDGHTNEFSWLCGHAIWINMGVEKVDEVMSAGHADSSSLSIHHRLVSLEMSNVEKVEQWLEIPHLFWTHKKVDLS